MKAILLAAALTVSMPATAQESRILPANTSAPAAPGLAYRIRGAEVLTDGAVAFKPGTATLLPAGNAVLTAIVKYLTDKPAVTQLRIEGHTVCGKGDQALSEARARAVADWLIGHGVDCTRLIVTGFGCSKPILADHAEANERIQFYNVALRGRLIGGMPADGGGHEIRLECP